MAGLSPSVFYRWLSQNETFLFQLFSRVREVHPEYKDVIHVMKGDMSEPSLGLSEDDQRLLHETVEIVFHSAATVRFDEELRYTTNYCLESGSVTFAYI